MLEAAKPIVHSQSPRSNQNAKLGEKSFTIHSLHTATRKRGDTSTKSTKNQRSDWSVVVRSAAPSCLQRWPWGSAPRIVRR